MIELFFWVLGGLGLLVLVMMVISFIDLRYNFECYKKRYADLEDKYRDLHRQTVLLDHQLKQELKRQK